MLEPVNMLVWQAVGNALRVDLSLKMVSTPKTHGRVNGCFRNPFKVTQHKSPVSAGLSSM